MDSVYEFYLTHSSIIDALVCLTIFIGVSVLCPGVVSTDFWNATRNRPSEFGGPAEAQPGIEAIMERGKDALEIGRQAVAGVERGDFFILTHPHVRRYVETRYKELFGAFDAQAPYSEDEERFDITTIALDVAAHLLEPGEK